MPEGILALLETAKREGEALGEKVRRELPKLDLGELASMDLFHSSSRPSARPRRSVRPSLAPKLIAKAPTKPKAPVKPKEPPKPVSPPTVDGSAPSPLSPPAREASGPSNRDVSPTPRPRRRVAPRDGKRSSRVGSEGQKTEQDSAQED